MDDATLRLNISYVLHEPSTGNAVKRAARESRRFHRRRPHLLREFSSMPEEEFARRLLIHPSLSALKGPHSVIQRILMPSVGLPELMPLVSKLLDSSTVHQTEPEISVVDGEMAHEDVPKVKFFDAPATLSFPSPLPLESRLLVSALIVRPGEHDLMLAGRVFEPYMDRTDVTAAEIIRVLENLVRDFVNQWIPARPLWSAPVETLIPESRNRATSTRGS